MKGWCYCEKSPYREFWVHKFYQQKIIVSNHPHSLVILRSITIGKKLDLFIWKMSQLHPVNHTVWYIIFMTHDRLESYNCFIMTRDVQTRAPIPKTDHKCPWSKWYTYFESLKNLKMNIETIENIKTVENIKTDKCWYIPLFRTVLT